MDRLDLEPSWWSRNTGDLNEEDDLLDPTFRAAQEHTAAHNSQPTVHFTLHNPHSSLPLTCSTLLLATEPLSSSFLRATLLSPTPSTSSSPTPTPTLLATLALQSSDAPTSTSLESAPYSRTSFYSLSSSVILGLQYAEVAEEEMTAWTEGVLSRIQPKRSPHPPHTLHLHT